MANSQEIEWILSDFACDFSDSNNLDCFVPIVHVVKYSVKQIIMYEPSILGPLVSGSKRIELWPRDLSYSRVYFQFSSSASITQDSGSENLQNLEWQEFILCSTANYRLSIKISHYSQTNMCQKHTKIQISHLYISLSYIRIEISTPNIHAFPSMFCNSPYCLFRKCVRVILPKLFTNILLSY